MTLIVDPTSDVWIEHPRKIIECLVAAALKPPYPHGFTNCLECPWTGRRKKRSSVAATWPFRFPWTKTVPKEVELLYLEGSCAIGVLAVDDLRLLCMERQSAFQKSPFQYLMQSLGFMFASAVADDVVGIPFKLDAGKSPLQPYIEHVVQEEVRQQGADDSTLRRASFALNKAPVLQHRRCLQPTFDVEKCPTAFGVLTHCLEQQLMIDVVEEPFDVDVQNPVERQQR